MELDLSAEQQALRDRLRGYFAELMTDEARAALSAEPPAGPTYRRLIRQMGADGLLGIGWPAEYGGQGRSSLEQYLFFDEAQRARAPVPMISLNTVGPTLMTYGSPEQKAAWLPRILRGEIDFAIGYSEQGAGTDLAALSTRAVRDGDHYIVNGSKIFTSRGQYADYIWLAARTDPDAGPHQGISILVVDTASPGFKATPIRTIADYDTYVTYYEDVRVPVANLVGQEHDGWRLITTQLNHERVAMAAMGGIAPRLLDDVLAWAATTPTPDGGLVIDLPWAQLHLARAHTLLEAMKLLNWRVAWSVGNGALQPAEASGVKVYGTETVLEVYRLLQEVLGAVGALRKGSRGALVRGDLEWAYRRAVINTFGGGTNEIQREIIARAGLRMPKVPR